MIKTSNEDLPFASAWSNALGMQFRLVAPGRFEMGSPKEEARRFADEELRSVTITKDFYLAIYPTTQAEWRAVLGENPSKRGFYKRVPVDSVSWFDSMRFIEKLNSEEYGLELRNFLGEDWKYSLPTEAQWEYACRAGSSSAFYFGNAPSGKEGNFGKGSIDSVKSVDSPDSSSGSRTVSDVGSYPPNPWGFFDMCGNVCEWTLDGYADYDLEKTIDPLGVAENAERVARGGSWKSVPDNCRSASRFNFLPTYRGDNCGLRVAIVRD